MMQSVRCQLLTVFLLFFFQISDVSWCSVFLGQFCDVVKLAIIHRNI
jgi:hypothetical protein